MDCLSFCHLQSSDITIFSSSIYDACDGSWQSSSLQTNCAAAHHIKQLKAELSNLHTGSLSAVPRRPLRLHGAQGDSQWPAHPVGCTCEPGEHVALQDGEAGVWVWVTGSHMLSAVLGLPHPRGLWSSAGKIGRPEHHWNFQPLPLPKLILPLISGLIFDCCKFSVTSTLLI